MAAGIGEQLRSLIMALIAGGGAGLLYDFLRPRRGRGIRRGVRVLLYILLCAGWIFLTGLRAGVGSSVGYLSGVAAGMCFYNLALHPMMAKASSIGLKLHFLKRKMQKSEKKSNNNKF